MKIGLNLTRFIFGLLFILSIAALSYAGYIYWCYSQPARISVTNSSDIPLHEVVVSGSGFQTTFDEIRPDQTVSFTAEVSGESGLEIQFKSNSKEFKKDQLAYLEARGGYRADITVNSEMDVICKNSFR